MRHETHIQLELQSSGQVSRVSNSGQAFHRGRQDEGLPSKLQCPAGTLSSKTIIQLAFMESGINDMFNCLLYEVVKSLERATVDEPLVGDAKTRACH